ncbi:MAG: hypothetical protein LC713_00655 [Actinobacteria bacterium]|nr:hypothetical protein [Actinomycetota bacterium]
MDPATLAAAVLPLVLTWFRKKGEGVLDKAADSAGAAALDKLEKIYHAVLARFSADPFDEQVLDRVAEDPENGPRQKTFEAVLTERLGEDVDFAKVLEGLLQELSLSGGTSVVAIDTGIAAGGDVTQSGRYVAGRDLTVNDPDDS